MKDIKIYTNDFGCFSLHDSIEDIQNKLKSNREIKIEVKDRLVIVRDSKNKDNNTNAVLAFILDETHEKIQIIDLCSCIATDIKIEGKKYSFSEFKDKYGNKENTYAICSKTQEEINPFRIQSGCNSICSKNNMECYLNCIHCGELKHRIEFKEHNIAVEYWEDSDDTMVSMEIIDNTL